jgi:hypothetical protein
MAKLHGPGYWNRHLEAWHQSDLTQCDYCKKHGLCEQTFYRWKCKREKANAPLTLVPATVGATPGVGLLRLTTPKGLKIEVQSGSAAWLAELLRQLS